ncbi:MAG: hypothetical protein LC643_00205 [Bacteroidales bacterium]|nr:hypothetical protein [Bacteroidales bacterium]
MKSYYNKRINSLNAELKALDQRFLIFYFLRLATFLGFIVFLIWMAVSGLVWQGVVSGILFGAFLWIVKVDLKWVKQQVLLKNRLLVNQDEIKYLDYDFSDFDRGEEFVTINPHLAGDFDIFGESSLYQYLSRSVLQRGRVKLANALCKQELSSIIIKERQEAIRELAENPEFLESFQALGRRSQETGQEESHLKLWLNVSTKALVPGWLLLLYPCLVVVWIILVALSVIPGGTILLLLVLASVIVFGKKKAVDVVHNQLGKSAQNFGVYEQLIHLVENQAFQSPYLVQLQSQFLKDGKRASLSVRELYGLLEKFDYRYNMIVGFLFNLLFLFDLQMVRLLGKWKEKHRLEVTSWLDALSDMDAINGLARFAMNNTEQVSYPEVSETGFEFEALQMGHPLISADDRVNNDVHFTGQPKVVVVTGANMAGKSTFLRTLTVNLILAMNGAPVVAQSFRFSPCFIMSSINIRDSLSHKASYFYSELLRIREIIDHVKMHPQTLVILDEILRGTNTKDKQAGSLGLLDKLIAMKATVVIATHDLTIGDMDKKYPEIVTNHCFEVELEGDQLVFDYQLKTGVSQKLNASFLMRQMGVID